MNSLRMAENQIAITPHLRWCGRLAPGVLLGILLTSLGSGCSLYQNALTETRLDQGMTIVLPGIEGASPANGNVARGLETGEVQTAIRIHDWTTGIAPLFLLHLRDSGRHQRQANKLAQQITDYQTLYPDRPVFLIGHSGGGAMALLTLEALPADHQVTAVFLLAPAVSPRYPMEAVLARTELGIWNFYSPLDFPLLIAGTSVAGTLDGKIGPSAGALGFNDREDAPPDRLPRLTQVPYSPSMLRNRHPGGHFGWTDPSFIREHLAPLIRQETELRHRARQDVGLRRLLQSEPPAEWR